MTDDLRQLYQEVILDHGRKPRNLRAIDGARTARGHNPMCGDQLTVFVKTGADRRIDDIAFVGRGCAISTASASLMTEVLKGRTEAEARALFDAFHKLCTGDDLPDAPEGMEDELDRLTVLSGVRQFPVRVKCATLAWHTLEAALKGDAEATTEGGGDD